MRPSKPVVYSLSYSCSLRVFIFVEFLYTIIRTKNWINGKKLRTVILLEAVEASSHSYPTSGKTGIDLSQAYQWGNTRNGYWRTVQRPIPGIALSNALLKDEGLLSLKEIVAPKPVYV